MKFTNRRILAAGALLLVVASGCDRAGDHDALLKDVQVAWGSVLFAENCARCHGAAGQGSEQAPALVGEGALAQFTTARDVFEFASENMPFDRPGSLEDREYLAILAFALEANEIALDEPLGLDNAGQIELR